MVIQHFSKSHWNTYRWNDYQIWNLAFALKYFNEKRKSKGIVRSKCGKILITWSWVGRYGGLLSTSLHIWNFSEYKIIFKYTLQNLGGQHKASPMVIPRAQKICFPHQKDPSTLVIQRSEKKDRAKGQGKPGQEPSWTGDRRKPLCRIFVPACIKMSANLQSQMHTLSSDLSFIFTLDQVTF